MNRVQVFAFAAATVLVSMTGTGCQTPKPVETGTVVFATRDIPMGELIGQEDVEERQVEKGKIPEDALSKVSLALGRYSGGMRKDCMVDYRYTHIGGAPMMTEWTTVVRDIPAGYYVSNTDFGFKEFEVREIGGVRLAQRPLHAWETFAVRDLKKGQVIPDGGLDHSTDPKLFYAVKDIPANSVFEPDAVRAQAVRNGSAKVPDGALTEITEDTVMSKFRHAVKNGEMIYKRDLGKTSGKQEYELRMKWIQRENAKPSKTRVQ